MGPGHYNHNKISKFKKQTKNVTSMFKSKSIRQNQLKFGQIPASCTYNLNHYLSNNTNLYRGSILSPVFMGKR